MRVLQIGPYPPPHGGVQSNLVAIRDYLRQRGIWCAVINPTRFRTAREEEVYHPRTAPELALMLFRLRYDIIHLHIGGNVTRRLAGLAALCSMAPWARAVLTFHSGGYPSSKAGRSARPFSLLGFIFRRFDRIICVNSQIAEMFARFGVPRDRLLCIAPYRLPAASGEPLPEEMEAFAAAHDPVLVTVGLIEPEYDLELQIEALGRVREKYPRAGLLIVGAGSLEREIRGKAEAAAYGHAILVCGDVPHRHTLALISRAAVFLRTTKYDGDSVAVREALHAGTPVIASDNGMRPEGVRLFPAGCLEALLEQIDAALSGAAPGGRPRPLEADESNIEAVFEVYRELLHGRA